VSGDETTGIAVVSVGYLDGRTVSLQGTDDFHESLTYSVSATDGSQYIVTIDMGVVSSGDTVRPVLLSAPLVQPRDSIQVLSGVGVPDWPAVRVSNESALFGQVDQWVRAWTTNDGSTLKSLAGDPSSDAYAGLLSSETWEVDEGSVGIVWAAERPSDELVVVRVTWDMQTSVPVGPAEPAGDEEQRTEEPSAERPSQPSTQQKTIRQSVDLLVTEADSGLPRIVSWGAPGTYETLTEFQNAIGEEE
jgi:hypothetical protein